MTPEAQSRRDKRLDRQFQKLARDMPMFAGLLRTMRKPGWTLIRVPLGFFLFLGGFLAILPVFGLWMIPLGMLLLAVDIPFLKSPVAGGLIRGRRRLTGWRRRFGKR